ncbi:histidine kinase [Ectothiorhodospiraceae bacterium WFHF3C12]|nr:histidine kinase [Ectothiorhodospiraceae bacterium WFHF3C12]
MNSLRWRAGLATMTVVAVFAAATAVALDQAFRDATRTAWAERLRAQVFLLMGATEVAPDGQPRLPDVLPEVRLEGTDSGLFARILDGRGETLWRSPSALGYELPAPAPGSGLRTVTMGGSDYFSSSIRVDWQLDHQAVPLTFQIVEDRSAFAAELTRFRRTLWTYLGIAAAGLVVLQGLALRWGLRPLRGVERELYAVERGSQQAIHGRYPRELERLTMGLNTLLHHERAQQRRYRDALGDLAHSLKTPLAIMRGALGSGGEDQTAREQLERMDRIIGYQLQRATTSGRTALVAPVALKPVLERLIRSLAKVYAEKAIRPDMEIDGGAAFRGNEDDLMEVLGNLLDNAFKWGRETIQVRVTGGDPLISLVLEDDGPGIPESDIPTILSRGGRLDEAVPGQGIGLAVVRDVVDAYGGTLTLERSESLGGLRVTLQLPGFA